MKLLITGDIHGRSDQLQKVIQNEGHFDMHLNTGDLGIELTLMEATNMLAVKGNNDVYYDLPTERILKFDGYKILITHGHLHHVKYGLNKLINYAEKKGVDLCIFGHTHQRFHQQIGNILYLNPGALSSFDQKSYIVFERGKVRFKDVN